MALECTQEMDYMWELGLQRLQEVQQTWLSEQLGKLQRELKCKLVQQQEVESRLQEQEVESRLAPQ